MATPTPTIPSFTDGMLVHATDLNALASNLTNLYNYNQASFNSQRPCVIAKQTTGQTINSGTDTLVNFQTATVSTDNMWTASAPNKLTIQHAGIYWLFGQLRFPSIVSSSVATIWSGAILANGTSFANAISVNTQVAPQGAAGGMSTGVIANLAVGATLYLNCFQSTGANQTLVTDAGGTYLGAIFLTSST